MTDQIILSHGEGIDLERLDFRQAKEKIEELYNSIRSEKIRTFYCEMLRPYFLSLQKGRRHRNLFAGVTVLKKRDLELMRMFGDTIDISGILALVIGRDVSAQLAAETIKSISVAGFIFAPDEVWDALKERIHSGMRA